ncbi:hypothetical protein, partial [Pectobacterium carotovorum]|uniref:hypothetical protein n=1 Tax=Pectobacterium brasiliense TaxID=180957 RepID=UPI001BE080B2
EMCIRDREKEILDKVELLMKYNGLFISSKSSFKHHFDSIKKTTDELLLLVKNYCNHEDDRLRKDNLR